MSFNRLQCDHKNHIHNSFGQAQFMCYPVKEKHINLFGRELELMYPESAENEDRNKNEKGGHRVYNAPYDIDSPAGEIAEGFAAFIQECEEKGKA